MSCRNQWDPCSNTVCTCAPAPCPPTPCTTGCLIDVPAPCVYLNEDLTVCTDTYVKGTKLDRVLQDFATKLCGEIVVTTVDIHSKVSSTDTTSDYLKNKLTGSNAINVAQINIGGDEELVFSLLLSEAQNNCLQILGDGLYMACSPSSNGTATTLSAILTPSIEMIVNPVTGGYTVKGNIKIDTTPGNALIQGVNGLYVAPYVSTSPVTLTPVDTATIDMIITPVGSIYNVAAQLRMDPAGTLPWSIGPNGLKLDCCATGNTLLTRTNTQSIHHTLTPITGGYDISSEVVIDPSGTNILQSLSSGLYVPDNGSAITPDDTDSINLTILPGNHLKADLNHQNSDTVTLTVDSDGLKAEVLVDNTTSGNIVEVHPGLGIYVPSSPISYSADTCNAAQAGTDGNLFVQSALLPYGLVIYKDGANITARFNGPSSSNADYEVLVQGTTGSPLVWVNVDSGYDSVTIISGISTLFYHVATTSAVESSCNLIGVKVRQKCTNGNGEWLSAVYDPSKDYIFSSSDGSVSIESGINCGLLDFTIPVTSCASPDPSDVNMSVIVSNGDAFLSVAWSTSFNHDYMFVEVPYTDIYGNTKHIQENITAYLLGSNMIPLPLFNIAQTQTLSVRLGRTCSSIQYIDKAVTYTALGSDGWIDVPSGLIQNSWNHAGLKFRIRNNMLEFKGEVYKTFGLGGPTLSASGGATSGSYANLTVHANIFDISTLLTTYGYTAPSLVKDYGLKDYYSARKGVYNYGSGNSCTWDSTNFNLQITGTMFQSQLYYQSYADDDNYANTGIFYSSAGANRNIVISFNNISIELT